MCKLVRHISSKRNSLHYERSIESSLHQLPDEEYSLKTSKLCSYDSSSEILISDTLASFHSHFRNWKRLIATFGSFIRHSNTGKVKIRALNLAASTTTTVPYDKVLSSFDTIIFSPSFVAGGSFLYSRCYVILATTTFKNSH